MNSSKKLKITVFSDLHYKKGMYIAGVEDLEAIFDRAHQSGSELVIHCGDLCNDYLRSIELTDCYINNKYSLPVYGVYGNHELESEKNSMQLVTPLLCNKEVIWGTKDGKIGDSSIAYYYFDRKGFRFISLDTNYSYNEELSSWQHNLTASRGAPSGNIKACSLGPEQLKWLEGVLDNALENKLSCIVISHRGFCDSWANSPDSEKVRSLFASVNSKKRGTVLLSLSGDLHTNHQCLFEDVVYLDINTVRNGLWLPEKKAHYQGVTFPYVEYDSEGKKTASYQRPVGDLVMGDNTWFFDEPLSAVILVSDDGEIIIEGSESHWYGEVFPDEQYTKWATPFISDGHYKAFAERD